MKVQVGFVYSYDGFHTHSYMEEVFGSEEKAIEWVMDFNVTQSDWRDYTEYEVK